MLLLRARLLPLSADENCCWCCWGSAAPQCSHWAIARMGARRVRPCTLQPPPQCPAALLPNLQCSRRGFSRDAIRERVHSEEEAKCHPSPYINSASLSLPHLQMANWRSTPKQTRVPHTNSPLMGQPPYFHYSNVIAFSLDNALQPVLKFFNFIK